MQQLLSSAETSAHNDDLVIVYDDSASALRKMTRRTISGVGAGSMSSFTLSADAGSDQTISDANTLEINWWFCNNTASAMIQLQ